MRAVALLIVLPLYETFADCHTFQEFLETAVGLSALEQVGVVAALVVIAAVLAELTEEMVKLLIVGQSQAKRLLERS
jgi:hypothetical protein